MAAMNWDRAFEEIIGHEGKLSLVRTDDGNWTGGKVGKGELKGSKYGVSAKAYPFLDIRNLTLADAKVIARRDYWDVVKCDALPSGVDLVVFDLAYNGGPGRAAVHLQKAAAVKVDMKIGPVTIYAVDQMDPKVLIDRICDSRLAEMKTFSDWEENMRGWTIRVAAIRLTSRAWAAQAKPPGQPDDPGPEPTPPPSGLSWWRRLINNLFKKEAR